VTASKTTVGGLGGCENCLQASAHIEGLASVDKCQVAQCMGSPALPG